MDPVEDRQLWLWESPLPKDHPRRLARPIRPEKGKLTTHQKLVKLALDIHHGILDAGHIPYSQCKGLSLEHQAHSLGLPDVVKRLHFAILLDSIMRCSYLEPEEAKDFHYGLTELEIECKEGATYERVINAFEMFSKEDCGAALKALALTEADPVPMRCLYGCFCLWSRYQAGYSGARDHLEKAVEAEHPMAQVIVGRCLYAGSLFKQDIKPALASFRLAYLQRDPSAAAELASRMLSKPEQALNMLYQAVDPLHSLCAPDPLAQAVLGMLYFDGEVVKKDLQHAFVLLDQSAPFTTPQALVFLGRCHLFGHGTKRNDKEALATFALAFARGSAGGQFYYGYCLFNGYGCDADEVAGKPLMKDAKYKPPELFDQA